IATRRHQFTACPAQPLVIPGFLHEPLAERAGVCLRAEVRRRVVYGLHSRAVHDDVSEAEWVSAPRGGRSYRFCVLASPAPEHRLSRHLAGFLKLRQALSDPRFSRFIEQLTGIPTSRGEFDAHIMVAGDFLAPHTDAVDARRLACVIFLSSEWHSLLGG